MKAFMFYKRRQTGVTIIELISAIFVASTVLAILSTIYLGFMQQYKQRLSETRAFQDVSLINKQLEAYFKRNMDNCVPGIFKPETSNKRLKQMMGRKKWEKVLSVSCYEKGDDIEPIKHCLGPCTTVLIEWEGIIKAKGANWPVVGSLAPM